MSSFERNNKGPAFQKDSSIYSLFFGTRTKLLEDELNELQWTQVEILAEFNRNQRTSGLLQSIKAVGTSTDNIFYFQSPKVLSVLVDGYLLKAGSNAVDEQPLASSDDKLFVKLNGAPTTGTRTDLVMLEAWFETISHQDTIRKFGGDTTPILQNNLLDPRANAETARRIQLKWRLRVINNATSPETVEALKPDGTDSGVLFTSVDGAIYSADIGLQRDSNMDLESNGVVYAIPLATVDRKANVNTITDSDINIAIETSNTGVADINVEGDSNVGGNSNIGGDLNVDGNTTINGDTIVNNITINGGSTTKGDSIFEGDIIVQGNTNVTDINISGNATIGGDLIVDGTVTYLNTTELNIKDNIITLNSGTEGNPTLNAGIEVDRGDLPKVSVIWNESIDSWQLTTDGTNFYNIITSNDNVSWNKMVDRPTTLEGYGITDAAKAIHSHKSIDFNDTRAVNHGGFDYSGVTMHMKSNSVDGLNDGGTYHGTLHLTQWQDSSGGYAHQMGFTDNQNVWHRHHNGSAWQSWKKIWDSGNFDPNTKLNVSGGTLTGTLTTYRLVLPVGTNLYA